MKITVNEQIYLSEVQPSDQAACVDYLNEKAIYDLTLRIPYPYTETHFQESLRTIEKLTQQQGQPVQWAIRKEGGLLIGRCGFNGFEAGQPYRAEIGYWLAKPYWGRGIMTAVVRRACDFAFAELGLVKIMAHVFGDNLSSARVLEKTGFEQEGYLRKHFFKEGRYLDAKLFGLVKE